MDSLCNIRCLPPLNNVAVEIDKLENAHAKRRLSKELFRVKKYSCDVTH
jgi:hypothetical protein